MDRRKPDSGWNVPVHTRWAGRRIHYFQETDSTNSDAVRLAGEGAPHGTVVVADRQNKGRGRRGRVWQSPPGKAIYFTILLKPEFGSGRAAGLTLVMALSAVQAVRDCCGLEAGIKWPNDLVVNGKKICGILTELHGGEEEKPCVVIGVGINVNLEQMPEGLTETATSLFMESGIRTDRSELLAGLLERFEENYRIYEEHLSMAGLLEKYNSCLVNRGRQVRVLDPKGEFEGIAGGINAAGELLVETEDGTVKEVYAGEVSVRGIYGYV